MKFLVFLVLIGSAAAPCAAPVRTEHVEAELVAAANPEPGRTLTIALRLKSIPHWHTYWRNPGDSGQPTTIEWKLPPGWEAGPIQWPAPTRLPAGPLMNFGYEEEVLLLTDIRVPKDAQAPAVSASAAWLVCNESRCVPEDAVLNLSVDGKWKGPIERTRAGLPVKAETLGAWKVSARGEAGRVILSITPPSGFQVGKLAYFPFDEGKIHNPGAQGLSRDGDAYLLELPRSKQPVGAFTKVAGLLVSDKHPRAVEIEAPVVGGASGSAAPTFVAALLFAFIGGLILNLMPCVLPVLSIKILGFAQPHAAGGVLTPHGALRAHGALYALGVIVSFLAFAALLVAVKGAGAEVGWGFQLQSPWFVGALALLFFVLALNLSGVFEFGSVLPAGLLNAKLRHPGADAFLTGVLAVAIASPCTAPFMGAALGYALSESATAALAVFGTLGIGMALPYVALSWNPAWLRWLPKPGRWMLRFKQALAVPLYATVIWLGWVLALQTGVLDAQARAAGAWEPYSEQRLEALTKAGKPVFVDFTAAWCVTCQVNKKLVLSKDETTEAFRSHGVSLLRADWTRRDPEITRALAALGRNGIPVYALYPPGREPQILPEILTRDALLGALESLQRKEPSS